MHQCQRCGKDTDHYYLCDECLEQEAGNPKEDYKAYSEKMDKLWEREEDAYLAAHGY